MTTPPWLRSLLEEHLEELQMLGELRRGSLQDEDYTISDLLELDQRIEAHVDALVLAQDHSLPLLHAGLAEEEWSVVFAASLPLLRLAEMDASERVMERFLLAEEEAREGIREALLLASVDHVMPQLLHIIQQAGAPLAVAAAEVAAYHGRIDASIPRLRDLLADPEPNVREAAWRVAAILDSRQARAGGSATNRNKQP